MFQFQKVKTIAGHEDWVQALDFTTDGIIVLV